MENRERLSQTDMLVEELKTQILTGRFVVGEKLPTEKMLCKTHSVGRSTVREAVRTLQVMGYVEIRPGRGAFFLAKNPAGVNATLADWVVNHRPGMEEAVRVRLGLESIAIAFAVEKASDNELLQIDRARRTFEEARLRGERTALAELDERFHHSIISASHSEMLVTLNGVINAAFWQWREHFFVYDSFAASAAIHHQRITASILARDEELAVLQLRRHMASVLNEMLESSCGKSKEASD